MYFVPWKLGHATHFYSFFLESPKCQCSIVVANGYPRFQNEILFRTIAMIITRMISSTGSFSFVGFMLGPLFALLSRLKLEQRTKLLLEPKKNLLRQIFQTSVPRPSNAHFGFASYCAIKNLVWLRKDAKRSTVTSVNKVRFFYPVKELLCFWWNT